MSNILVAKWVEVNLGDSTNAGSDTILRYALGGIDITHDGNVFKADGNLLDVGDVETPLALEKTTMKLSFNSVNLTLMAHFNQRKYLNHTTKAWIAQRNTDGSLKTSTIRQIFNGFGDTHSVTRNQGDSGNKITYTSSDQFARFEQLVGNTTSASNQKFNIQNGLYPGITTTTVDKGFDHADDDFGGLTLGKVPSRTIEHTQIIEGPRKYILFGPKSRTVITTTEYIPGDEGEQLSDAGSDYTKPLIFGGGHVRGNLIYALNPTPTAVAAAYPGMEGAKVIKDVTDDTRFVSMLFALAEGEIANMGVLFSELEDGSSMDTVYVTEGNKNYVKDSSGNIVAAVEFKNGSYTQTNMTTLSNFDSGWTTDHKCLGTVLVLVTLAASPAFADGFPQFTFVVGGKKHKVVQKSGSVYSLTDSYGYTETVSTLYGRLDEQVPTITELPDNNVPHSASPAFVILDILLSNVYGLGVAESEINLKSFYDSYQNEIDRSNAQVGVYDTVCRGVLKGSQTAKQRLDSVLAVAKANICVIDGKINLIHNKYLGTDAATIAAGTVWNERTFIDGIHDIKFSPTSDTINTVDITAPVSNSLTQEEFRTTLVDRNALAAANNKESKRVINLPMGSVEFDANGNLMDSSGEVLAEIGRIIIRRSQVYVKGSCLLDYWSHQDLLPGDIRVLDSKRFNLTGNGKILVKVVNIKLSGLGDMFVEFVQFSNLIYDVSSSDITEVTRGIFPATSYATPPTFDPSGSTGLTGFSNALVRVFKKASTEPTDKPTEVATYTFNTATTEYPDAATVSNGWHTTVDAATGTGTLYARLATAVSRGATDTIAITEWSGVNEVTSTGIDGEDGINGASVNMYQRTAENVAPTTLPQSEATYTFSSGAITPSPNSGWYPLSSLTGAGNFIWVTTATAASRTSTDTIPSSEWSTPILSSEDGADGVFSQRVYKDSVDQPTISGGSFNRTTRTFTPPTTWSNTPTSGNPQRWFAETQVDLGAKLAKEKTTLVCNGATGGTSTAAVAQVNTALYNSGTSGSSVGSSLIAEEGFFDIDGDFPAANFPTTRDSLKTTFSTGSETEFTFDNFDVDQSYTVSLSGFTFPITTSIERTVIGTSTGITVDGKADSSVVLLLQSSQTAPNNQISVSSTDILFFTSEDASSLSAYAASFATAFNLVALTSSGSTTTVPPGIAGEATSEVSRNVSVVADGTDLIFTYLDTENHTDAEIVNQVTATSTISNVAGVYRPRKAGYDVTLSGFTFPISGFQASGASGTSSTLSNSFEINGESLIGIYVATSDSTTQVLDEVTFDGNFLYYQSSSASSLSALVSEAAAAYQAISTTGQSIKDSSVSDTTTYTIVRKVNVTSLNDKITFTNISNGELGSVAISNFSGTTSTIENFAYVPEPNPFEYFEVTLSGLTFPLNSSGGEFSVNPDSSLFTLSSGDFSGVVVGGIASSNTTLRKDEMTFNSSNKLIYYSSTATTSAGLITEAAAAFQALSSGGSTTLNHFTASNSTTATASRNCNITSSSNVIKFTFDSSGDKTDPALFNFGSNSTLENFDFKAPITLPDYSTTSLVADRIVSQGYTGVTLTHDNTFDTTNNPLGAGDERIKWVYDTLGTQTDVTTASFVVEQGTDGTLTLEDVGIVTQGGGVTHTGDVLALTNVDTNNGHSASAASTTLANTVTGNTVRDAIVSLWSGFGGFTTNTATAGTVLATDSAAGDSTDPVFTHTPGTGSTLVVSSSVTTDGADAFTSDTNTLTINIDGVDYTIPFTPDESSSQQATTIDTALEAESAVTDDYTVVNTGSEVVIEGKEDGPKDDITVSLDSGKPNQTATTPSRSIIQGVGLAVIWSTPVEDGTNVNVIDWIFNDSATVPSTPADSAGVPTGWLATPPASPTNEIYVSQGVQTAGYGNFVWGTPVKQSGADGTRSHEGFVYYETAQASAPTAATFTTIDFETGSLDGLTSGWTSTEIPGTASANGKFYWKMNFYVTEAKFDGAQTVTYGTVTKSLDVEYDGTSIVLDENGVTTVGEISASQVIIDETFLGAVDRAGNQSFNYSNSVRYTRIDLSGEGVGSQQLNNGLDNGDLTVVVSVGNITIDNYIFANGGGVSTWRIPTDSQQGHGGDAGNVSLTATTGDIIIKAATGIALRANGGGGGGTRYAENNAGDGGNGGTITLSAPLGCIKIVQGTEEASAGSDGTGPGNNGPGGDTGVISKNNALGNACVS